MAGTPAGTPGSNGAFPIWSQNQKVILVILENTDYSQAMAQPFFTKLSKDGALFNNYHAIGHPSQPNYVAMVAGDTLGVSGDGHYDLAGNSLVDLLEAAGKTWKVYAEDYPGNCFQGDTSGKYARKHNPLISFKNIQSNPTRCANIMGASTFNADFKLGHLPNFTMYVPNLNNDGHDTGPAYADNFMSTEFGPLIYDPQLMNNTLLVVTFDEDDGLFGSNQIYTVVFGPGVKPGTQAADKYSHYSLLRTLEDGFQLGHLGRNDSTALPFTGVWQ